MFVAICDTLPFPSCPTTSCALKGNANVLLRPRPLLLPTPTTNRLGTVTAPYHRTIITDDVCVTFTPCESPILGLDLGDLTSEATNNTIGGLPLTAKNITNFLSAQAAHKDKPRPSSSLALGNPCRLCRVADPPRFSVDAPLSLPPHSFTLPPRSVV